MDDDARREAGCSLYSLVRVGGLAIFFLGIAIIYTEPGAARWLAAARRDRRDPGRDRCPVRAAVAEESVGRAGPPQRQ